MLRVYVSKKQTNWEDYFPILEFVYNSVKHVTIGFSSFTLMYDYPPRSPMTVGLATETVRSRSKRFSARECLEYARVADRMLSKLKTDIRSMQMSITCLISF